MFGEFHSAERKIIKKTKHNLMTTDRYIPIVTM